MRDLFDKRAASPMLIGKESEPFDDPDCIFELKLDGERCLAYLDGDTVELRNKRSNLLLPKFRELEDINKQVKARCILDGELAVLVEGRPSFHTLLSRIMMSGRSLKSELAREKHPACFTAFDILYYDGRELTSLPLTERKALLGEAVAAESERLALSRCVEGRGRAFFELAKARELEGIVAKRKQSLYLMGRRTTDWVKIKYLLDDDFVVCGFIPGEGAANSLVLGKYSEGRLVYKGHVTVGASGGEFKKVSAQKRRKCPFTEIPKGHESAVWLEPALVCTAKFMARTASGSMRQAVFKCLREDKRPEECRE